MTLDPLNFCLSIPRLMYLEGSQDVIHSKKQPAWSECTMFSISSRIRKNHSDVVIPPNHLKLLESLFLKPPLAPSSLLVPYSAPKRRPPRHHVRPRSTEPSLLLLRPGVLLAACTSSRHSESVHSISRAQHSSRKSSIIHMRSSHPRTMFACARRSCRRGRR